MYKIQLFLYLLVAVGHLNAQLGFLFGPTKPLTYGSDYMTKRDKDHICQMTAELYSEALLKVHQSLPIRDSHEAALAFQIGIIIGTIRERYRRLTEMYREYHNKESFHGNPPKTYLWPPGIARPRLMFYVQLYEYVYQTEIEIRKLIEILDNFPRKLVGLVSTTVRLAKSTKRKKSILRRNFKEERYKSRLREKYLLKKLGLNTSLHTTKPRFIQGWPVEDTWDNLQY